MSTSTQPRAQGGHVDMLIYLFIYLFIEAARACRYGSQTRTKGVQSVNRGLVTPRRRAGPPVRPPEGGTRRSFLTQVTWRRQSSRTAGSEPGVEGSRGKDLVAYPNAGLRDEVAVEEQSGVGSAAVYACVCVRVCGRAQRSGTPRGG